MRDERKNTYKIRRRQYAVTPGYAFTDYKSQGQTIENVIIDIGRPPTGKLSPFGTYVALSRSRARRFRHHSSEELRKEMIRGKIEYRNDRNIPKNVR